MKEYEEMLAWLLSDDGDDGSSSPVEDDVHGNDVLSYLQSTIDHQDCFSHESFEFLRYPGLGSQILATSELGRGLVSILHEGSTFPMSSSPDCGAVSNFVRGTLRNVGLVDLDCVTLEGGRTVDVERRKRMHNDEQSENAMEDAMAWKKLARPKRQRRDAEKHSMSERNRRQRIRQKIQTLKTLVPNSNKLDAASVLGNAINYVKELQSHIQEMITESCEPPSTPVVSSLARGCHHHHEQSIHQFGSLRPNQRMCSTSNAMPSTVCSSVLNSTKQCVHDCASPTFPVPVIQFPEASVDATYSGFSSPCTFPCAHALKDDQRLLVESQVLFSLHPVN